MTKIKEHPKVSIAIAMTLALGFLVRVQQRRIIYMPSISLIS